MARQVFCIVLALSYFAVSLLSCVNQRPASLDTGTNSKPQEQHHSTHLTEQQMRAMSFMSGMRNGNHESVTFAQKAMTYSNANVAIKTIMIESDEAVIGGPQLLTRMSTWPLRTDGSPWPLIVDPESDVYPRVATATDSTQFSILATDYDDDPLDPFVRLGEHPIEPSLLSRLRRQPADHYYYATASGIARVISAYKAVFKEYPPHPQVAFEAFRMGILNDSEDLLLDHYHLKFYRKNDESAFGLLLEGYGESQRLTRWFLYHEDPTATHVDVTPLGALPEMQDEIDSHLSSMDVWATWDQLSSVPRVTLPLPSE